MVLLLEALVAAGVVFLFYVFMAILTEKVYTACKKAEEEAWLTEEEKENTPPENEEKYGEESKENSGKTDNQKAQQTDKTAD